MLSCIHHFQLDGNPISCERYGNGHINVTYLLRTDAPHSYILQKISRHAFKDIPALMRNIILVTRHLAAFDPDPRHVLTLVPTRENDVYYHDPEGEYWRLYEFVVDSICFEQDYTVHEFASSAEAFGCFQKQLASFPAHELTETIPHFHDTPKRYQALLDAIRQDPLGRVKQVGAEIDFALARTEEAGCMVQMQQRGELPLRVTHNDTKINNVLFDNRTRSPLCVIDLDTVMPGLTGNDFGDSIRFGANTAAEDERDLRKVHFSLPMYQAYTERYLATWSDELTQAERETLPMGAKLMTLECGVRFLTDYLLGDQYFSIARPMHNLDRCRTQLKLVADMERHWDTLLYAVAETRAGIC